MADVSMPRLSDSMEEGTILKWLKSDGDEVKRGDELVEIETDKANMTYEADQDGVLSISASEGDTLAVGEKIASIGEGAEEEDEEPEAEQPDEPEAEDEPEPEGEDEPEPEGEEAKQPAAEEQPEAPSDDEGSENGRIKASPIARRMAREMGLELAEVEGSGPGGRIVKADVEAAAGGAPVEAPAEPEPEPAAKAEPPTAEPAARDAQTGRGESEVQELTRLQQTVARRMAESKATAPDFVLNVEV